MYVLVVHFDKSTEYVVEAEMESNMEACHGPFFLFNVNGVNGG